MATFIIDLMGDDDLISTPPEKTPEQLAREEELRRQAIQDILRRMPQPALQIVPTSDKY